MFGKKDSPISLGKEMRTSIGEGITINADGMYGSGDVRVAGVFFNDIEVDGMLIIQDSGTVRGNVKAAAVVVEGVIEGDIVCSGNIEITATGKVIGDLRCMTLSINEGAAFSGACEMGDKFANAGLGFDEEEADWDVDKEIKFSVDKEPETDTN